MAGVLDSIERAFSENPELENNASDFLKSAWAKIKAARPLNAEEATAVRRAEAQSALSGVEDNTPVPANKGLVKRDINFQMHPSSEAVSADKGLVPYEAPDKGLVPYNQSSGAVPESLRPNEAVPYEATPEERDVTPKGLTGASEEAAPVATGVPEALSPDEPSASKGISKGKIAAGAALGGLATYGLMNGSNSSDQNSTALPSDIDDTPAPANEDQEPKATPAVPKAAAPKAQATRPKSAASDLDDEVDGGDDQAAKAAAPAPPALQNLDFGSAEQNKNNFADVQRNQDLAILANQLGKAGDRIGAGINYGIKPVAQEAFDENTKLAQGITKDYLDRQAQDENDPNSGISKAARDYVRKFGINPSDGATSAQLKQVMPYVFKDFEARQAASAKSADLAERLKERQEDSANKIAERRDEMQQRSEDNRLHWAQLKAARDDMASRRTQEKQNQAFQQTSTLLESARGAPATQQAERDLYAANKADTLANLYGDPNKLSNQQVHLLASEIGKIAAGGSSTQAELEGITPSTLIGKMSGYASTLINSPTPAHAAAFVKQYQDYTNGLRKDAQNVINDRYGRIIQARSGLHSPEQNAALKQQYLERFSPANQAAALQRRNQPAANDLAGVFDPNAAQAELERRKQQQGGTP